MEPKPALVVFDFDHTFIDYDSDDWMMLVRPELTSTLLKHKRDTDCWTDFMGYVFEQVHQAGCTKEEMLEFVTRLVPFQGLAEALEAIEKAGSRAIFISDSNTVFIEAILHKQGLRHYFSDIITNPAHFDESGQLRIQHCHAHSCPKCTHSPNMCKGTLLREYLSAHGTNSHVIYIGDGEGDVCPSLTALGSRDTVLARKDYPLSKALSASTELKATLHVIDFESTLGKFLQDHFRVK